MSNPTPREVTLAQWCANALRDGSFTDTMAVLNNALRAGLDMDHPIVVACVKSLYQRVGVQIGPPCRSDITYDNACDLVVRMARGQ